MLNDAARFFSFVFIFSHSFLYLSLSIASSLSFRIFVFKITYTYLDLILTLCLLFGNIIFPRFEKVKSFLDHSIFISADCRQTAKGQQSACINRHHSIEKQKLFLFLLKLTNGSENLNTSGKKICIKTKFAIFCLSV